MYRIKNENLDFKIDSLGECKQNNPLIDFYASEGSSHFVNEKIKSSLVYIGMRIREISMKMFF